MRQIALDTETTGIGIELGHRVIEIGCVELIDRRVTGKTFHVYINPERKVDEGAFKVHGISNEFLQDKPLFKNILPEFIEFISDSELIIHNAPFDVAFLNEEFKKAGLLKRVDEVNTIFDTLVFARKKHPGQRNNLDALCKRYTVDNSNRKLHGALLDAEILAFVYLAMTGGQSSLFSDAEEEIRIDSISAPTQQQKLVSHSPVHYANEEELSNHANFIQFLIKKSGVNHWDAESVIDN